MPSHIPSPDAKRPARAGWRGWLLIASLALNVLVIGVAAGAYLRMGPPHGHDRGPSAPRSEIDMLWRALPRADLDALREEARARRMQQRESVSQAEGGQSRAELTRARAEALAAELRAEPFDAAPIDARLSEALRVQSERGGEALATLLARIASMSPEDRAAMATRILEMQSRANGAERSR